MELSPVGACKLESSSVYICVHLRRPVRFSVQFPVMTEAALNLRALCQAVFTYLQHITIVKQISKWHKLQFY